MGRWGSENCVDGAPTCGFDHPPTHRLSWRSAPNCSRVDRAPPGTSAGTTRGPPSRPPTPPRRRATGRAESENLAQECAISLSTSLPPQTPQSTSDTSHISNL